MFTKSFFINYGKKSLVFALKGPLYHYRYAVWRLNNCFQKFNNKTFFPDNKTFLARLDAKKIPFVEQKKGAGKKNDEVWSRLTHHFKMRNTPKFFFDNADSNKIPSLVSEEEREKTICSANEICQNQFRFRRAAPVKFDDKINWQYSPKGNIDWTWDLNRHTYFEKLGRAYLYTENEDYASKFGEVLFDWIEENPAETNQKNWKSVFEVAIRINTWIWAYYYFRYSDNFSTQVCLALLKGLYAHTCYLEKNLERHAQNNHLILEAKSLAMMGVLFPEFRESKKWLKHSLQILYKQVQQQVCEDGVHVERSSHYHRVVTGELLELFVLLENNKIKIPSNIFEKFNLMVEFELWLNKPDGLAPLLGDAAIEDTHLRFSAASGGPIFLNRPDLRSISHSPKEAEIWLLGYKRLKKKLKIPFIDFPLKSRAFKEGGYFIMRTGNGQKSHFLVFDCGPFGYKLAPNHGHSDALSFEMYAYGQTMLIDPGFYSTHLGENWRNYFRGTHAHNTIVVDDQDQSELIDDNRVYRPAKVNLINWFSNESIDFVDGFHDGYKRLPDPVIHRRQIIFVKPEYWIIIDVLNGREKHTYDQYFHFLPGTKVHHNQNSRKLRTRNNLKSGVTIVPLNPEELELDVFEGQIAPIQGWVSYFSGEKSPAPVMRYRKNVLGPTQFNTIIYPYDNNTQSGEPKISLLNIKSNKRTDMARNQLTGLIIETNIHVDLFVVDRSHERGLKYFDDFMTDGQLVFIRQNKDNKKIANFFVTEGRQLKFKGKNIRAA
jgi:hypothetical protein